jgi:hypothetical protein
MNIHIDPSAKKYIQEKSRGSAITMGIRERPGGV